MRPSALMRALVAGIAVAYVGLLVGFTVGFGDTIPALAWIGLGVVASTVGLVGIATIVAFERLDARAGAHGQSAPRVSDGRHRVLVVADVGCEGAAVCPMVLAHVPERSGAEVLVVAPTIVSPFHHLMDDEEQERATAGHRLDEIVALLTREGVRTRGMIGSDLPLEAIQDALATFPADEIVVIAPPEGATAWSERGLVDRARAAFGITVTHVPVARTADALPLAGLAQNGAVR